MAHDRRHPLKPDWCWGPRGRGLWIIKKLQSEWHLAGSVRRASDYWSPGHESEPHIWRGTYLKNKQTNKQTKNPSKWTNGSSLPAPAPKDYVSLTLSVRQMERSDAFWGDENHIIKKWSVNYRINWDGNLFICICQAFKIIICREILLSEIRRI